MGEDGTLVGAEQKVTLAGYQEGINSLAVRMDYQPRDCNFLRENQLSKALQCLQRQEKRVHIIFIGDSNIRMQQLAFNTVLEDNIKTSESTRSSSTPPKIETTRLSMYGGLRETLQNVSYALQAIKEKEAGNKSIEHFILFNSGLHDISKRCALSKSDKRKLDDMNVSCTEDYQQSLRELLQLVDAFPAKLKVFQSTTAGWPKFGNYGFAWPPTIPQLLPRDPTFIAHFNEAAFCVLAEHNSMDTSSATTIANMDAYWLTLARPDHREVNRNNAIGKHLVHAGPEVVSVLVRKWMMMILESVCGGYQY